MGVPIPKTSKTLLEKLRSGDPVSQEEFYARYREMIFALGRLKGLSETESEDLVQLVMSEFFQKSTDFIWDPARGKFRTWFGTVIKRRIIDLIRKRTGTLSTEMLPDEPDEASSPDFIFDSSYQQELKQTILQDALARLRRQIEPENYVIFEYYVLRNHSAAETMQHFQIGRNRLDKLKQRMLEILSRIGSQMKQEDPDLEFEIDFR